MPDTSVLVTRFLGTDSVGEVVDFMVPRRPGSPLMHTGRPHQALQQEPPQRQPSRTSDITARIERRQSLAGA